MNSRYKRFGNSLYTKVVICRILYVPFNTQIIATVKNGNLSLLRYQHQGDFLERYLVFDQYLERLSA